MPETPTPGQMAYAAYCRAIYGVDAHDEDYQDLTCGQHAAWEAAAQAVLVAFVSSATPPCATPEE